MNGQIIDTSRKLDPGWTAYETSVLYNTFDVTNFLSEGGCGGVCGSVHV